MEKSYLKLQPSEGFVIQAAANIYAAHILAGCVNKENKDDYLKQSIRDALRISIAIDEAIVADGEMD